MGKHAKYNRHYKSAWENENWAKGWLKEYKSISNYDHNDTNEAYCLYCHTSLRAHFADLKRHTNTNIHKNNIRNRIIRKKETVKHYFKSTELKKEQKCRDIKMSLFVLNHSSITAIDHLGELFKRIDHNGVFSTINLHHSKCGCIIRNYSLIVHESTDVSVNKYMAICVRYFTGKGIVTDCLGLIQVERATAEDLYNSLTNFLKEISLPLINMLALGTDGGANLCGKNKSLYTLLKNDIPHLILVKCACHSIHLCVSKASYELPGDLDYLAQEVYNWFSNSSLRRIQYKQIFNLINLNEDRNFKQFIQLSRTRWLSRYNVVKRLLENWLELKTFFKIVEVDEKCYKAKMINNILNDEKVYVYYQLILPFLEDTNNLNLYFQNDDCDVGNAYNKLFELIQLLAKRLIKPIFLNDIVISTESNILKSIKKAVDNETSYMSVEYADLGYNSQKLINDLNCENDEKLQIKQRFFNFMIKLLKEFLDRMPANIEIYKNIKLLNPRYCLNKQNIPNFNDTPILKFMTTPEFSVNNFTVPNNIKFWPAVYNYIDGSGANVFKELATVVIRLLCLPISNAVVERVFSVMNNIKTKLRNRMSLRTLNAVLITQIYLCSRNMCCNNFCPTEEMIELFNSNIYNENFVGNSDNMEVALELLE
ncbi:SCAN domain-containing protein 3-like [Prorops nasuta]|uniref:SCAN domain-containing protein 3-like n=1 Tax=Prorops nasuta TaxID=863751 RepID=UPI0034CF66EE